MSKSPTVEDKNSAGVYSDSVHDDTQSVSGAVKEPKKAWTKQYENVLASWADIAVCYAWMHDRSHRTYKRWNYGYAIPIIVLSTLTGTANFGISSTAFPEEFIKYGQIIIGGVSIFAGVLGTLQSFFRYAQNSESHFQASQDWSKLHRNITYELKIEMKNRKDLNGFMKSIKQEYDRLMSSSPLIPLEIVKEFLSKFDQIPNLIMPAEICDRIEHTFIYREELLAAENGGRPGMTPESLIANARSNSGSSSPGDRLRRIMGILKGNNPVPSSSNDTPLNAVAGSLFTPVSDSTGNIQASVAVAPEEKPIEDKPSPPSQLLPQQRRTAVAAILERARQLKEQQANEKQSSPQQVWPLPRTSPQSQPEPQPEPVVVQPEPAPVEQIVQEQIQKQIQEQIQEQIQKQIQEQVQKQIQEQMQQTVQESTQEPTVESTQESEPVPEPTQAPEPVPEPTQEPVPKPIQAPETTEVVQEPIAVEPEQSQSAPEDFSTELRIDIIAPPIEEPIIVTDLQDYPEFE
jgi:hypothetical protein